MYLIIDSDKMVLVTRASRLTDSHLESTATSAWIWLRRASHSRRRLPDARTLSYAAKEQQVHASPRAARPQSVDACVLIVGQTSRRPADRRKSVAVHPTNPSRPCGS